MITYLKQKSVNSSNQYRARIVANNYRLLLVLQYRHRSNIYQNNISNHLQRGTRTFLSLITCGSACCFPEVLEIDQGYSALRAQLHEVGSLLCCLACGGVEKRLSDSGVPLFRLMTYNNDRGSNADVIKMTRTARVRCRFIQTFVVSEVKKNEVLP